MPKIIQYIQSDKTTKYKRNYAQRKQRASGYLWRVMKEQHPDLFKSIIDDFNAEIGVDDEKVSKDGLL